MRLEVERLNGDASMILTVDGKSILIDPWLASSEVDGHPLFNESWHTEPCSSVSSIPSGISAVVISLPFADHCHLETLEDLDDDLPIVCNTNTRKVIEGHFGARKKIIIAPKFSAEENFCELKGTTLRFSFLDPTGLLDLTHGGIIIQARKSQTRKEHILFAPHGISKDNSRLPLLKQISTWALACITFSEYALPSFLGGTVNLGLAEAVALVGPHGLNAKRVIDIHSECKATRGLVPMLARTAYPQPDEVREALPSSFVDVQCLQKVLIS
jgi:hypothetical protein